MDLNTELTLRLSVSRFLATVLTATCHTCELQFRARGLFRTDFLVNEYGHSSSNLSRICRWMSDSTMLSVSAPGSQHSPPPMKLNRRRIIMMTEMGICRCRCTLLGKGWKINGNWKIRKAEATRNERVYSNKTSHESRRTSVGARVIALNSKQ